MMGLTDQQQKAFDVILAARAEGRVPSFAEIADGIGIKSKSSVHRIVVALEERGCIRRLPNRARAIEVISSGSGVELNAEICRGVDAYARSTGTTRAVAANELLRLALGLA